MISHKVYDITFYEHDENGVETLNEDGTLKLFRLKRNSRSIGEALVSEINELVEDTDVEKIERGSAQYYGMTLCGELEEIE